MINNEIDVQGEKTLEVISEADKFNFWMFETIKPFCSGNVLEVGSGIGNISEVFLNAGFKLSVSDFRKHYVENLASKFSSYHDFQGAHLVDLVHPEFENIYIELFGKFDTVFALNVVEHIENDVLAIQNCKKLLRNGGHLIILVPSYPLLFNRFDKELEHFRRYTVTSLGTVFSQNNLKIIHRQYFNFVGIFGWFLNGFLLNKETIPGNQMAIFNFLVPIIKWVDKLTFNKIGLSTILVGEKKEL
jgi:SAM-dependent methyltransferase